MQRDISTNIRIPEEIWRAVKIKAAEQGRSMKDLILEGMRIVLNIKADQLPEKGRSSLRDLFLEFSGKVGTDVTDGSTEHDRYIYDGKY